MRVAHLADLHLGFRAYRATNDAGRNQREADVEGAFFRAVEQIEDRDPDVILVAGDVFHHSKPHPRAIEAAEEGFSRLADVATVWVAGGNHEYPKSAPDGNALDVLGRIPNVEVYASTFGTTNRLPDGYKLVVVSEPAAGSIDLREHFRGGNSDPGKSILLMHGAVNQRGGKLYHHGALPVDALNPDSWALVALGDYHVFTRLAPGVFYSGSLEYTSTDIWMEARTGIAKGWVMHDLARNIHELVDVGARRVADLPTIDANGMTADELSEAVILAVGKHLGDPSGAIVRQVCDNVPRGIRRNLEWDTIRDIKDDALHYQLDLNSAERERILPVDTDGVPTEERDSEQDTSANARTPEGEARALMDRWDPTPGVDSDDVLSKTLEYMEAVDKQ